MHILLDKLWFSYINWSEGHEEDEANAHLHRFSSTTNLQHKDKSQRDKECELMLKY